MESVGQTDMHQIDGNEGNRMMNHRVQLTIGARENILSANIYFDRCVRSEVLSTIFTMLQCKNFDTRGLLR